MGCSASCTRTSTITNWPTRSSASPSSCSAPKAAQTCWPKLMLLMRRCLTPEATPGCPAATGSRRQSWHWRGTQPDRIAPQADRAKRGLTLVDEWSHRAAFESYVSDPELAGLHLH